VGERERERERDVCIERAGEGETEIDFIPVEWCGCLSTVYEVATISRILKIIGLFFRM